MAKKKYLSLFLFSDMHDYYHWLKRPKADYYLCTGDATNRGTFQDFMRFNEFIGNCISEKLCKQAFFVPGNHDLGFEDDMEESLRLLSNMTVLIDKTINLDGFVIHGTPYMPRFFDWAFMKEESELTHHWNLIPDNVDILLTHCPPYTILDQVPHYPHNVGSKTLLQKIQWLITQNLKLHVFGHIHEARGVQKVKETVFINASSLIPNKYDLLDMRPFKATGYLVKINIETKEIVKINEID